MGCVSAKVLGVQQDGVERLCASRCPIEPCRKGNEGVDGMSRSVMHRTVDMLPYDLHMPPREGVDRVVTLGIACSQYYTETSRCDPSVADVDIRHYPRSTLARGS